MAGPVRRSIIASKARPVRSLWSRRVYDYLQEAITRGEFDENEPLSEEAIAAHLGCSRTPVREALKMLCQDGYVTIAPNRGAFVKPLTLTDIYEIFQVREALESFAAGVASQSMPDDALAELEALLSDRPPESDDALLAGYSLHSEIRRWCGNSRLIGSLDLYTGQIKQVNDFSERVPGRKSQSHLEHVAVLQALQARDREAAEKAMRKHITSTMKSTVEAMQTSMSIRLVNRERLSGSADLR